MRRLDVAALLAALLPGCASGQPAVLASARCAGPKTTVAVDVRPLLERRCFACHAGDGPAAEENDFSRVETLRAQRQSIADAVKSRAMPPPGRPQLTDVEAQVLLRWSACGALE